MLSWHGSPSTLPLKGMSIIGISEFIRTVWIMTALHMWNEKIFICEKAIISEALNTWLLQFEIHKIN
jgi:hypothetical protein